MIEENKSKMDESKQGLLSSEIPTSPSFVSDSNAPEPMGELDGTISSLAMSAKYNLTQGISSPKDFLWARYSSMQSWGQFIDTSRWLLPISIQQWSKRLIANLKHFQSNYIIIVCILFIYCILTSPLLLLVLLAIGAGGYIITLKNAQRPFKIFGKKLNLGQQYLVLGICSLPLLYIVGAGGAVFWVIGASLFLVTLHASIYAIEATQQQLQQQSQPFAFDIENV